MEGYSEDRGGPVVALLEERARTAIRSDCRSFVTLPQTGDAVLRLGLKFCKTRPKPLLNSLNPQTRKQAEHSLQAAHSRQPAFVVHLLRLVLDTT